MIGSRCKFDLTLVISQKLKQCCKDSGNELFTNALQDTGVESSAVIGGQLEMTYST
jgi:hypothetical protein